MPRNPKKSTPQAREVIEFIVRQHFGGSQLGLADAAQLDVSAVSRLLNEGKKGRPATPDQIGRIVAVVPKQTALKLMTAFLSDIAAHSAPQLRISVNVSTR